MDHDPSLASFDSRSGPFGPEAMSSHREFVRAVARRLLLDDHGAEDVAQDALLAAIENPPVVGDSPRAWLATVALNLSRNVLRQRERRAIREAHAARPESAPSPADVDQQLRTQAAVVAAVRALREPYRTAVWMRWYEDMPPREIAKRTRTSVETVKSRLKRGLVELRQSLRREFGGDEDWRRALLPLALARTSSLVAPIVAALLVLVGATTIVGLALAPRTAPRSRLAGSIEAPFAIGPMREDLQGAPRPTVMRRDAVESRAFDGAEVPISTHVGSRTGRVVDARTGEALPLVHVSTRAGDGTVRATDTDDEGTYRLDDVDLEAALAFRADSAASSELVCVASRTTVPSDAVIGFDAVLEEEHRLEVGSTYSLRFELPPGVRAGDFRAELTSEEPLDPRSRHARRQVLVSAVVDDDVPWVRFDEPVRASLVGSGSRSTCRLRLLHRDGTWVGEVRVPADDGRHPEPVRVELAPCARLAGRVLDVRGRPIPAARVRVSSPILGSERDLDTDESGSWIADGMPIGSVLVRVRAAGHLVSEQTTDVSVAGDELRTTLTPRLSFSIEGELSSRTGGHVPVGTMTLRSLRDPDVVVARATHPVDGPSGRRYGFSFEGLEAGQYQLSPPMGDAFAWSPASLVVSVPGERVSFTCLDDVDTIDVVLAAYDASTSRRIDHFEGVLLLDRYGLGRAAALELEGDVVRRASSAGLVTFRGIPRGMRGWWLVEHAGSSSAWGELDDLRAEGDHVGGVVRLQPGWTTRLWIGTRDAEGRAVPLSGARVSTRSGKPLATSLPDGRVFLDLAYDPGRIAIELDGWKVESWDGFSGGKLRRTLDLHRVWLERTR